jgi:hypothetical protein
VKVSGGTRPASAESGLSYCAPKARRPRVGKRGGSLRMERFEGTAPACSRRSGGGARCPRVHGRMKEGLPGPPGRG